MKALRTLFTTLGFALLAASPARAETFDFDPTKNYTFLNEFDRYLTTDWTLNTAETGTGAATEALTNVDGGALLVTTDDADNDNDFFQLPIESFKFDSTKRLYFETRFKVADATNSDVVFGLQITDTSPLDVTDGIFFLKPDDAATLNFLVEKNNTATTASAIATLANDTWVTLAFYYEPSDGRVAYFVDGVRVGASAITNVPDDEELTVSFGYQNGAAGADTMTVDYIMAVKQRD